MLLGDFEVAGGADEKAERLAIVLRNDLRLQVKNSDQLKLSPHSLEDVRRAHDEIKDVPLGQLNKGLLIGDFNVDFMVGGSIIVE